MGFLAPWFLAGLVALGVPVFVHLLRKHVTVPRPVSSLMFFERGTQSSTKHRRLRYLLLFALRLVLLLLVILAFANPFLRRPVEASGRLLLIVVDHSFSMRAGTRFADAKRKALAVLAAKPRSQRAQVLALGGTLKVLTQPVTDGAQLQAAIESIQPEDGYARFAELGRGIRTMTEETHEPIDVHLFSDMQHTAMPAMFSEMMLPENAHLALHDVAPSTGPENWTIESVSAPAMITDPKNPRQSHVQAVIVGFNTPSAEKLISLTANGKVIASRKVRVPANGRATVEFAPLDLGYGFNRCEMRIDAQDAFPVDDESLFVIRRSDSERVLFVHAASDIRSPLYFGAALEAGTQGSFALQSVTAEQTRDLDPSKYAFVVLSDTVALPSIFEHSLDQYVAKGGGVLIALGTGAGQHAHIPLWEGDVQDIHSSIRTGGAMTVGAMDFTHPALEQSQAESDHGAWANAKVFYAAVVNPAGARVAARLNDGTPLLLDKQAAEGRVLLFASGLDNLTNDLPLQPVFVAFIDKVSRYLSGDDRETGSRLVDSFVKLRSGAATGEARSVEVIDPDGRRPLSLSEARVAQTFRLRQTGFYQIRYANGHDAVVGVNPNRRESDLTPMAKDVQQLWSGNHDVAATASDTAPAHDAKNRRLGLWWYVMLLASAVALAECVLAAGYMGTQREEA